MSFHCGRCIYSWEQCSGGVLDMCDCRVVVVV